MPTKTIRPQRAAPMPETIESPTSLQRASPAAPRKGRQAGPKRPGSAGCRGRSVFCWRITVSLAARVQTAPAVAPGPLPAMTATASANPTIPAAAKQPAGPAPSSWNPRGTLSRPSDPGQPYIEVSGLMKVCRRGQAVQKGRSVGRISTVPASMPTRPTPALPWRRPRPIVEDAKRLSGRRQAGGPA